MVHFLTSTGKQQNNNLKQEDKKMKLVKWNNDPVFPVLFNRFFTDDLDTYFPTRDCGCFPATNIVENDKDFEIEFAVPGRNKDDIKISIENDVLTVSSEKESKGEEKGRNFTRKEFVFASFKRSFTLPKTVDAEQISASYNNGILKIGIPKKEEAQAKLSREIKVS
jgi:HSP20 family protein